MDGVRVLEFGCYLAGPLVGKHLAAFGATVRSVRRPQHARGREDECAYVHDEMAADLAHGKEIVPLDLPREAAAAHALVKESDVLIENFSHGVMRRLGVDLSLCQQINPRLIYVSLPGFLEAPPDGQTQKAWDSVVMASLGVFMDMGLNRTLLGVEANDCRLPMASVYADTWHARHLRGVVRTACTCARPREPGVVSRQSAGAQLHCVPTRRRPSQRTTTTTATTTTSRSTPRHSLFVLTPSSTTTCADGHTCTWSARL